MLCKCSKDAVGLVCLGFRVQGLRVRVEGLGVEVALTLATLTVRLAMAGIDIIRVFKLVHTCYWTHLAGGYIAVGLESRSMNACLDSRC